ncbi:tRNA-binding protein [Roseofilum capinflatum]|uniref:tRNA-binding protein n=1 Tax=Roseofilum capinflatum BLCC-M114 TaxID=3022440 RepID=A0ABT7B4X3_9CYAN|nr:tRNA-binding protein [Roseofilum capinflatum]MDJ1174185.1 tRNA-binding protein [Roseofilum capinflatum BLCC-M114]
MSILTLDSITYEDFAQVDIRVGKIIAAQPFPQARKPAYQLRIDFGPLGIKKSSAQITQLYALEELPDRLILAVVNLPPRQIANFMSEVLVLGVVLDNQDVVLIQPDRQVSLGQRVL